MVPFGNGADAFPVPGLSGRLQAPARAGGRGMITSARIDAFKPPPAGTSPARAPSNAAGTAATVSSL